MAKSITRIEEVSTLIYVWVFTPAVEYMSEETTIAFAKASAEAEGYTPDDSDAQAHMASPDSARVTFFNYTK